MAIERFLTDSMMSRSWRRGGFLTVLLALLAAAAFLGAEAARRSGEAVARDGLAESDPAMERSVPAGVMVPPGMVYVPGGRTLIGDDTGGAEEAGPDSRHNGSSRPVFWAEVKPFLMDQHPVTVAEFRAFADATGFVTEAERFGDAGVLDDAAGQWRLVPGASWRQPFGPEGPPAPDDHPVTQVSWNDAVAYAEWAGKRLPTEVEWEHAARNARNARDLFPWGNEAVDEGGHRANLWQGHFPVMNRGEDGYLYTSPVGAFGQTELGLSDMAGNVWEWCQDWYRPYADRDQPFTPIMTSEKVQRGGSFQCQGCHGFRVYTRSHATPETALFHVGFRCVRDLVSG